MSDQPTNRPPGNNPNNNQRHNNQRRRPHGPNPNSGPNPNGGASASPNPNPNANPNARRRHGRGGHNRGRNPNSNPNQNLGHNRPHQPQQGGGQQQGGINIERIYEKYLNLLDQHLIARRKYHDLFYRAEGAQKNKLERNFYNTLHDIRDFESKLAPEARELFEKRNNGLRQDNIYTSNHELPLVGENPPPETESADPHFLQSQKAANYADDKEESVGSADDYLRYKNLI